MSSSPNRMRQTHWIVPVARPRHYCRGSEVPRSDRFFEGNLAWLSVQELCFDALHQDLAGQSGPVLFGEIEQRHADGDLLIGRDLIERGCSRQQHIAHALAQMRKPLELLRPNLRDALFGERRTE